MTIHLSFLNRILLLIVTCIVAACQESTPTATPEASDAFPSVANDKAVTNVTTVIPIGERSYTDRPDDFPGDYQVHVLYVLPADARDQRRDLDGAINKSIEVMNNWLYEQSDSSQIRFDTYQGQLDVTFIQLEMNSEEFYQTAVTKYGEAHFIRDVLEEELSKTGIFQAGKIYVALFEIDKHPSTCGDAAHPPALMGRLAGLYPSAVIQDGWNCFDEPFGAGYASTDMSIIHEIVHLLGFSSACGSNPASAEDPSHTSDDNRDLMWAPVDRADDSKFWDAENMLLDPGNDDYFKHGIANCPDLANSAFLDPLPANPETPLGWPTEWKLP